VLGANVISTYFFRYLHRLPRASAWIGLFGYAFCILGGAAVLAARADRPSIMDGSLKWIHDWRAWSMLPPTVVLIVIGGGLGGLAWRWRRPDRNTPKRVAWDPQRLAGQAGTWFTAALLVLSAWAATWALAAQGRPRGGDFWWSAGVGLIAVGTLVLAWRAVFRALVTVHLARRIRPRMSCSDFRLRPRR
jgi:hypothetical protein